jgi:hypothetical protein
MNKTVRENVLLQERIESSPVIIHNQRQEWNVRVFVSKDDQGRPKVSDMVVRIGPYGSVINGTKGASWVTLESLSAYLGLDDSGLNRLKDDISKASKEMFAATQEAMAEDDLLKGSAVATDYMGVDIMVRNEGSSLVPYLIEANGFRSGGGWPLDQVLIKNGETARFGQWAKDYIATMRNRGIAYRAWLSNRHEDRQDAAMTGER